MTLLHKHEYDISETLPSFYHACHKAMTEAASQLQLNPSQIDDLLSTLYDDDSFGNLTNHGVQMQHQIIEDDEYLNIIKDHLCVQVNTDLLINTHTISHYQI